MKLVTQRINDWNTPHCYGQLFGHSPPVFEVFSFFGGRKTKVAQKKLSIVVWGELFAGGPWRNVAAFPSLLLGDLPPCGGISRGCGRGRPSGHPAVFCGENAPISMQSIDLNSMKLYRLRY